MSAIGPGDWVECIDAKGVETELQSGRIYCVDDISVPQDGCRACNSPIVGGIGLWLVGLPSRCSEDKHGSWKIKRFRPIYRPKSEFSESLMQPAPELEPA